MQKYTSHLSKATSIFPSVNFEVINDGFYFKWEVYSPLERLNLRFQNKIHSHEFD